jgi:phosphotriesterase-related protein
MGSFITVQGKKPIGNVGPTLIHEHLLIDARMWKKAPPNEATRRVVVNEPYTLENRGDVLYGDSYYSEFGLLQTDINVSVSEALKFKEAGGSTIIDLTQKQLGRDPEALYKISLRTGLNIVMGTGYYLGDSVSQEDRKKSEKQLRKEIINEFHNGIGSGFLKIRPGIIGEIGLKEYGCLRDPFEVKNLKAAGSAQKDINCAMSIHMSSKEKNGHEVLDILEEIGCNMNKVILSHCDWWLDDIDYLKSLIKRNVYIAFDGFGQDPLVDPEGTIFFNDKERISGIIELANAGLLENLLISQDAGAKFSLTKWGGFGYAHILKHIYPRLIKNGLSDDQFRIMVTENPKKILEI